MGGTQKKVKNPKEMLGTPDLGGCAPRFKYARERHVTCIMFLNF
jgi:hypothetical protein